LPFRDHSVDEMIEQGILKLKIWMNKN
jgi:hypothetical protein